MILKCEDVKIKKRIAQGTLLNTAIAYMGKEAKKEWIYV